jgi:hypothetical protein
MYPDLAEGNILLNFYKDFTQIINTRTAKTWEVDIKTKDLDNKTRRLNLSEIIPEFGVSVRKFKIFGEKAITEFANIKWFAPFLERGKYYRDLVEGRLFLVGPVKNAILIMRSDNNAQVEVIGKVFIDQNDIILKDGKPYIYKGAPLKLFSGNPHKQYVYLGQFLPGLTELSYEEVFKIKESSHGENRRKSAYAIVYFGGIGLSFPAKINGAYFSDLKSGRILLRGYNKKIEIVRKFSSQEEVLVSIDIDENQTILKDGQPWLKNGHPVRLFSTGRNQQRYYINLSDFNPGLLNKDNSDLKNRFYLEMFDHIESFDINKK